MRDIVSAAPGGMTPSIAITQDGGCCNTLSGHIQMHGHYPGRGQLGCMGPRESSVTAQMEGKQGCIAQTGRPYTLET